MSEITMTRGWPLKSSTCVAGSGCAASGPVIAAPNAPSHKTRTDLISPLYDIRGGAMHGLETLARRPLPAGMSNLCHRQDDLSDVRAALHVAGRGGGLREREDAIHQHLHRTRFHQRPDAGAQFARDLAFLGDGARAHGGPGHREAL